MKIEEFLLAAMNEDKHGFFQAHNTATTALRIRPHSLLTTSTSPKNTDHKNNRKTVMCSESQDGDSTGHHQNCCCLLGSELSALSSSSFTVRRVKSTPDLLQIPSVQRSRKKSNDSTMGSNHSSSSSSCAEESEFSDKSVESSPPATDLYHHHHHHRHHSQKLSPSNEDIIMELPPSSPTSTNTTATTTSSSNIIDEDLLLCTLPKVDSLSRLLRPPSVVVSDHDLSPGGDTFITFDELNEEYNQTHYNSMGSRRLSDCSTCSSLSFDGIYGSTVQEECQEIEEYDDTTGKKVSNWKKVKTIVHQLTPFIQSYKNLRYQWVQLAGHQGNFKPGEQPGTILKKYCDRENDAFTQLMNDSLKSFIPQYYGVIPNDSDDPEFIQLEDLLGQFNNPCVMDCKLGIRTYLEEELIKAKEKPKLRNDMYEKMCKIDPDAPTPEEKKLKAVTKPRYMVWRETISTTSTLGFRVEGVRMANGYSSKDFKTTRSESQVKDALRSFIKGFSFSLPQYLERLRALKVALAQSQFFANHEVIGSSLLLVHDESSASIWMIDFAKTCPLPEGSKPISHDKQWLVGNHEDGYLIGLSNLIKLFEELSQEETNLLDESK